MSIKSKTTTITIRVTEEEKKWLQLMANFYGITISELVMHYDLDKLEDKYDVYVAEESYKDYEKNKKESRPLSELIKELDL
jgi:uncharacterized protein (DUF1778 family)